MIRKILIAMMFVLGQSDYLNAEEEAAARIAR